MSLLFPADLDSADLDSKGKFKVLIFSRDIKNIMARRIAGDNRAAGKNRWFGAAIICDNRAAGKNRWFGATII